MSVWEDEVVADISYLLKELSGEWYIQPEEAKSSHYMPFLCYLVDGKKGKKIEVHAHKKIVESISEWNPDLPKEKRKSAKKLPDVDDGRCAWLGGMLRK